MLRAIRREDAEELQDFIRNLSPASRYYRFMMGIRELPEDMLERFANPDLQREAVLVATSPSGGIIGLAQYVADEQGDGCEVALVVTDAWQRQGLGTGLLSTLMDTARRNDIGSLHADVLADNHAMRALARKLGCVSRTVAEAPFLVRISCRLDSARDTTNLPH